MRASDRCMPRRCKRSRAFSRWRVRTVPRAQNATADALVNAALDAAG